MSRAVLARLAGMLAGMLAALLAVLLVLGSAAGALAGDDFDFSGNVRSIPVLLDSGRLGLDPQQERIEAVQTLLRLIAEGRPSDRFSYETHLVQSHTWRSGDLGAGAGDRQTGSRLRYRALDATWDWWQEDRQSAALWLDRLNVRLSLPAADVTVGRQAVTFGKAYFWNPLDVFLPFDPNLFDRDYKAGVDAVRVDLHLDNFSGVTVLGAWGRELRADGSFAGGDELWDASWYGSAVLGRYFTTLSGWDLALQAGKIYGGYQLGGGLTGELGPLEIRAEGAYLWAIDSDQQLPAPFAGEQLIEDHGSLVLGSGHRFQNSLLLEVEHFINGAGDPRNLAKAALRLRTGAALHLGRHVTGVLAGYDFTPLLRGQLAALYSWSDDSFQIQPVVTLSLADNADLLFGVNLNHGARPALTAAGIELRSEFGSVPDVPFSEIKLYF